ncbi:MAG TPA: carboxypeptidase-like regulatory domain-containing protein [Flavobacteriales bacterium]|nr:carboxypeptidase-like regulatory domain-containing protein [Flavobacteriales bacterium]
MVRKLSAHATVVALVMTLGGTVQAQTTSSLAGTVFDATTSAPLPGATVLVFVSDTSYGTSSDEQGRFRFAALPTGIHRVRASYVGYRATELPEVWVRSGREERVELALAMGAEELGEVLIRVAAPQRMDAIGTQLLTQEQTLRYPATFYDPARLAMSYAGVASTNDQANHFSVRGNGPASNAWLLEGAEIVNPNHLANAGTQSDLPTLTGGGTTILSAQMLGTSRLLMGGMAAPYGNALGGIMDLHLRPGSTARRGFTAQAGLIGIDLSAEGPFKKDGRGSYLVNYRYSTLGLLGAMGVKLGDEAITFQDLSFNVSLPIKERSVLTVFGMGGSSSNRFDAKDSTEWEYEKDSQDIDYTAKVGAVGLTFKHRFGERTNWNTTAVISENDQERTVYEEVNIRNRIFYAYQDTAALRERKLSLVTQVRTSIGARAALHAGISGMERTVQKRTYTLRETTTGWLLRPFARLEYSITERLRMDIGAAYAHWTGNGSGCVEPRLSLQMELSAKDQLALAVGQRSQLPAVQNYAEYYVWNAMDPIAPTNNTQIGLVRSQDLELAYEHAFRPFLRLKTSAFVQQLTDVPVGAPFEMFHDGDDYSLANEWDEIYPLPLVSKGKALNAGGQIALERTVHRDIFYQMNATVFNATYTDDLGKTYDSRWNTGMIGNAVLGKEFVKQKEDRKRTWGVNGRINFTGGQRYTPSRTYAGEVVQPYSAQYNSTYRLDIRIYLKRERKQHTGMWSLDLLNATNAQNVAYQYYDNRKNQVVTKYQLGLIPNLSYRIEF